PDVWSQLLAVRELLSSRGAGIVPPHVPVCLQISSALHRLPSLHERPAAIVSTQAPVRGSQTLARHWSVVEHATGFAPVQLPAWQVSNCVHAFPSLHGAPSLLAGFEHVPVAASHVPTAWH